MIILEIAKDKGLQFLVESDRALTMELIGDDIKLQQIILNLCNNSLKYTKKGSVILRIEILDETDLTIKIKFNIIDTGIGISKEDIKNLFKPFSQFNHEVNKNVEGTGLGLAIVKGTVDSFGGSIGVQSELGTGSTFWIDMEFQKYALVEKQRTSDSQFKGYNLVKDNIKILIADDYKFSRIILKKNLKKIGYNLVDIAENGSEAVSQFKQNHYDIIFMDCLMPVMDGFDTTSAIRKIEVNTEHSYIIALSADITTENKELCINSGMDYYVTKPFKPELIEKLLREIVLKKCELLI